MIRRSIIFLLNVWASLMTYRRRAEIQAIDGRNRLAHSVQELLERENLGRIIEQIKHGQGKIT